MLKTNPFAKVIISPHFSPPFLIFFSKKVIFLIFNALNMFIFLLLLWDSNTLITLNFVKKIRKN